MAPTVTHKLVLTTSSWEEHARCYSILHWTHSYSPEKLLRQSQGFPSHEIAHATDACCCFFGDFCITERLKAELRDTALFE